MPDSSLLIVTSTSVIAMLDIRTMEITIRFQHPLELGVVTATCPSTHWIILGTDSGSLSLWDLRFGLLLKSWRAGGSITAIQPHPSKGRGRWIMVSIKRQGEGPLVEVYDIETGKLVEIFEVRTTRPTSKDLPLSQAPEPPVSKDEYIAEILRQKSAPDSETEDADGDGLPSVMSLIVGHGFAALSKQEEESSSLLMPVPDSKGTSSSQGWMITAGEDRVVRYWDLGKISDGFVICGSPKEKEVQFK
jgi:phosphoinositide-3-kinase regulatory subunit 4